MVRGAIAPVCGSSDGVFFLATWNLRPYSLHVFLIGKKARSVTVIRTIAYVSLVFGAFGIGFNSYRTQNFIYSGLLDIGNAVQSLVDAGQDCSEIPNLSLPEPTPTITRRDFPDQCCTEIAHAGGSFQGVAYTNSREALDRNFGLGRRIFEIDFIGSCDGQFVLAHNWDHLDQAPTVDEFKRTGTVHGLTAMSLADLVDWLSENEATIITDTKVLDGPRLLLSNLRKLASDDFVGKHFVFQTYSASDYMGLDGFSTILTTYRMDDDSDAELVRIAREAGSSALTIPEKRARQSLVVLRQNLPDTPIFVHGPPEKINSKEYQLYLEDLGASGFFVE